MSSPPDDLAYGPYETLAVSGPKDGVLHVELNRPDKLNAMNERFWNETRECFLAIAEDMETRVVVISARGRAFTAGLDISEFGGGGDHVGGKRDPGRKGLRIRRFVLRTQDSFNALEAIPQPVIVVGHGAVVGGGIDLMCACCIRYASSDAWFTIKEIDVGLAADVGTLQRMPKIVGNEGVVRELAYTARRFDADEAHRIGFLTRVFQSREEAMNGAMELAQTIAQKSPLAVVGTKRMITYNRDHSIQDGLDYIATWNGSALQAPDMALAAKAGFQKKSATFAKL